MSYTPPAGNAVNFVSGDSGGYTPPAGNAVNFVSGSLQAGIGAIDFVGGTPVYAEHVPSVGIINFVGGIPGFSYSAEQGVIGLIGGIPSTDVGAFRGAPSQCLIDFEGLIPAIHIINTHAALTFPPLQILASCKSFSFVQNLGLQTQHKFNPILISPDDVTYQLVLDNGITMLTVPMHALTLRRGRNALTRQLEDTLEANCPAPVYAQAEAYIGSAMRLYRTAKGVSQLLSAQTLTSAASDYRVTQLKAMSVGAPGYAVIALPGAMYTRMINSSLTIRIAPNFAAKVGSEAMVDGISTNVSSVVIYIAKDQQFMELS